MSKTWIVKFYQTVNDMNNKNPFHIAELVGDEKDIVLAAEKIKAELQAASYKIKVNKDC